MTKLVDKDKAKDLTCPFLNKGCIEVTCMMWQTIEKPLIVPGVVITPGVTGYCGLIVEAE